MSTMAVTADASLNTVSSVPPPPSRQSVRKRTGAAVSTRGANREVEEDLSLSQTTPSSKNVSVPARKTPKSPIPQNPRYRNPTNPKAASARLEQFKIFIVLVFVAALGATLCNWNLHRNESSWLLGFSMLQGRISELEEFLKNTKMMQVQLALVDIKIGKQVEGVRKELEDKIEEQTAAFLSELRNLQEHTGEIEESLLKLGQALSLDDVRTVAKRIVEAEIEKYSADGLGKIDYALGSGGGRVVRHSEGYFVGIAKNWGLELLGTLNFMRRNFPSVHPYASKMLEPSFGEPGQCLPLKGNQGFVEIVLRTSVLPEAITLEHVAKSVAYDRSSAPKDFRIFGWLCQYKDNVIVESEQMFLGEFSYDLEKGSAQTFNLPVESRGKLINVIKLDILSNHGSPSHTCIYRLRVHGSEPKSHTTAH